MQAANTIFGIVDAVGAFRSLHQIVKDKMGFLTEFFRVDEDDESLFDELDDREKADVVNLSFKVALPAIDIILGWVFALLGTAAARIAKAMVAGNKRRHHRY